VLCSRTWFIRSRPGLIVRIGGQHHVHAPPQTIIDVQVVPSIIVPSLRSLVFGVLSASP